MVLEMRVAAWFTFACASWIVFGLSPMARLG